MTLSNYKTPAIVALLPLSIAATFIGPDPVVAIAALTVLVVGMLMFSTARHLQRLD